MVALHVSTSRSCLCGAVSGEYTDLRNAVYRGPAVVLGFDTASWVEAMRAPPRADGMGHTFTAFVIPVDAASITKTDSDDD